MAGKLADIMTCAKFQDEIFRGYHFTGGRISHFPIDFCMGLTTVQRDCAACDSAWLPDWQLWATPVICINPRWPFKFWKTLNISGTAKARNLKFGVRIDYDARYSKNSKLGDKMGVA